MHIRYAVLLLAATTLSAQERQQDRQPDFKWEKSVGSDKTVSLHNINGDITVSPSTSGKLEITGLRRRTRDDVMTVEIVESERGVTACAINKRMDQECYDGGMESRSNRGRRWRDEDDYDNARIDIDVKLPRGMRLTASTVSGDVQITGAEGYVKGGSVSGDVRIERVRASSVRASSVSGNVNVIVDQLTSSDGMLSFSSVSGDVTVELPKDLNADVSMRSVSGQLDSDFPLTLNGRVSKSSISARIGRGGRELEVHTVSGDVRLRTARP